jgi:acyl-coenzyme A synthetase/AMP-(fatty) acid ligase
VTDPVRAEQILEYAAEQWPDRAAIIDAHQIINYHRLYEQTTQLRHRLQSAGVSPGHGLGVMAENGSAFVAAMLAGMGCGAAVLPLAQRLTRAEVDALIADTGLHAILDGGTGIAPIPAEAMPIPFAEARLRLTWTDTPGDKPISPHIDAAFIRYTSGTTGASKGVVLSHQRVLQRVAAAQQALQLTPDDTVLWVLPMAFHFLVTILVYLRCGAAIVVCQDLLAQTMLDHANRYRASMLYAAPMHYRLLSADRSGQCFTSLRRAISTTSALPLGIAKDFQKRYGLPVVQAYGIIEAGLPLLDGDPVDSDPETVGYPAPGFAIAILDQDDAPVAKRQVGRLALRGPGMFDAYLTPWQRSEQIMDNGWFMTGDLARRTESDKIVICGREKAMINVSGNKVFPEEVEAVLNSHAAIRESRVFGRNHSLMGEIVCADVVTESGVVLDSESVLHYCRQQLAAYKLPQQVRQVSRIDHTLSGKIQRHRH